MTFTVKSIAAATLIALGAAAPAVAADVAPGSAAAIAHFNQTADSQDGVRVLKTGTGTAVSTRSGNNDAAYGIFNANADTQDGVRGLNGATLYSGTISNASSIFADIRSESAEGE